ncbi:MAG: hypothetical protein ACOX8E_06595 [Ruminococcus sp.]
MEYMNVLNEGQVRLRYSHKDHSVDKDCYVDGGGAWNVPGGNSMNHPGVFSSDR